jgi:hypothetical protein
VDQLDPEDLELQLFLVLQVFLEILEDLMFLVNLEDLEDLQNLVVLELQMFLLHRLHLDCRLFP